MLEKFEELIWLYSIPDRDIERLRGCGKKCYNVFRLFVTSVTCRLARMPQWCVSDSDLHTIFTA